MYTVVASIVFTVSYFSTRNPRRAAFHAGIGIAAFAALAYLGGISEHSINEHLTAIDVSIVFLAVVACLVLKFTLSGKPSSEPMMWWQTLLIASLLFYFPAFVGGCRSAISLSRQPENLAGQRFASRSSPRWLARSRQFGCMGVVS